MNVFDKKHTVNTEGPNQPVREVISLLVSPEGDEVVATGLRGEALEEGMPTGVTTNSKGVDLNAGCGQL